jgi:hypothetical protein
MLKLMRVTTSGPFGTVRRWRHERLGGAIVETVTIPSLDGSADVIHAQHLAKVTTEHRKTGNASGRPRHPADGKPRPAISLPRTPQSYATSGIGAVQPRRAPSAPNQSNRPVSHALTRQAAAAGCAQSAHAVQAVLAELSKTDGAKILAPRLHGDVRGLEALLEQHGELALRSIKSVLVRGMIDGGKIGHVRAWAYFKPIIEQERARLCEACGISARAAGGRLSHCLTCLQARVDTERRERPEREVRAAHLHPTAVERSKACRACKVVKPMTAFHRHARATDGHRHDCRDCAKAHCRRAQPVSF